MKTKAVGLLLATLIACGAGYWVFSSREKNIGHLPDTILNADPAKLEGWKVFPPGPDSLAYEYYNTQDGWQFKTGGKTSPADTAVVRRAIKHLSNLKPSQIAGTLPSIYDQLGVGSNATIVEIKEGGMIMRTLYISPMSLMDEQQANYNVRIEGDPIVYVVPLYLDGSILSIPQSILPQSPPK